ncbi:hypothetical protein M0R45_030467 [Rubus argutus]|uniref:Uncharacterized protein n=1 Tax=Rubus argutus TaxID=59490 RepID=A0AAW1WD33_RUBAR
MTCSSPHAASYTSCNLCLASFSQIHLARIPPERPAKRYGSKRGTVCIARCVAGGLSARQIGAASRSRARDRQRHGWAACGMADLCLGSRKRGGFWAAAWSADGKGTGCRRVDLGGVVETWWRGCFGSGLTGCTSPVD